MRIRFLILLRRRLVDVVILFGGNAIGAVLEILQRADGPLHVSRQRRAAGGELGVLGGEEVHRQVQILPGGEVEHGVGELDLAADAAERLEAGGGLAHRQRLRRVLPRPLELEGGDVGGEAVDAEDHLPWAAALGLPRAAPDLAVVLPDPPPRVHREPDVGGALAARAE